MSHPPSSSSSPASFFPSGEGQRADCAIVSRAEVQAEAYLADLDGARSPLAPSWIDLGDWGQERVASQKEARVEEKKQKTCQTSAQGCKVSVVFAADPTNHGSIDRCPGRGSRLDSATRFQRPAVIRSNQSVRQREYLKTRPQLFVNNYCQG